MKKGRPLQNRDSARSQPAGVARGEWDELLRILADVAPDGSLHGQLAQAVAGSPGVGLYLVTPQLEIRYANPFLCGLLGYAPQDLVGRRVDSLIHPEDDRVTHALAETLRDPTIPGYALVRRFRHRDGTTVWTRCHATCLRDTVTGQPRFGVGILHDLSETMALQTERDRLRRALRRHDRAEALGTLTAQITHDFNNYLGAILGFSELAQQHVEEHSAPGRYLEQIRRAANRANRLVEQLTDFDDEAPVADAPISFTAVVRDSLRLLDVLLPDAVCLDEHLPDDPCEIDADESKLHQLITNLCTNGARAMPQGGRLTVSLGRLVIRTGKLLLTGELAPGSYVRLRVEDEGVGIPPERQSHLFDAFYAGDDAHSGSGLGLAIVRTITASLGGGIGLSSRIGQGTTFDIYLPAAQRSRPIIDDRPTCEVRGRGEHLLLVDDETAILTYEQEALTGLGYRVTAMSDSVAALHCLQADPDQFDLLLIDFAMPRMNGLELAQAALALRPDLPVVLISGHLERAARNRAKQLGIREMIAKPFSIASLSSSIARHLAN